MGDGLDLVRRDGFEFRIIQFGMLEAQAVKLIQRRDGGEVAEVLAMDFFLADDFCLCAFQFLGRQSFSAQQFGFLEQFAFDLFSLGRFGAGVKSEVAGDNAREILRDPQ